MNSHFDLVISVVMNMLVFGGIIYGMLARSKGKPLAVRLAIFIPLASSLATLLLRSQFVWEERLLGAVIALGVGALLFLVAKRRGIFASSTSEIEG